MYEMKKKNLILHLSYIITELHLKLKEILEFMWSKHFVFLYEATRILRRLTCPRSLTEKKGFAVQIHIKNVGKNQLEV